MQGSITVDVSFRRKNAPMRNFFLQMQQPLRVIPPLIYETDIYPINSNCVSSEVNYIFLSYRHISLMTGPNAQSIWIRLRVWMVIFLELLPLMCLVSRVSLFHSRSSVDTAHTCLFFLLPHIFSIISSSRTSLPLLKLNHSSSPQSPHSRLPCLPFIPYNGYFLRLEIFAI